MSELESELVAKRRAAPPGDSAAGRPRARALENRPRGSCRRAVARWSETRSIWSSSSLSTNCSERGQRTRAAESLLEENRVRDAGLAIFALDFTPRACVSHSPLFLLSTLQQ